MCIGLAISGFMLSFMFIPNMTEMMAAVQEAYPSFAGSGKTNSMLSGLLNSSYALGQFLGPLISAYTYQLTDDDFRMTMNIIALVGLGFAFLYIIFARGCQAYFLTCKNFRHRNEIAAEARKDSTASGLAVRSDRLHSIVFRTGMISVASSSRSMRKAS